MIIKFLKKFALSTVLLTFCLQPLSELSADPLDMAMETAYIPIIMYHRVTDDPKAFKNKWAITPKEFEEDLSFLKENGFETVVMSDLIKFVNKDKKLPERPVVLTFDDGDSSVYEFAFPLLKQFGAKAVVSVIGKVTDEYTKEESRYHLPHMTWPQVKELSDSGLIEIQNHSYDLHKGSGVKSHSQDELMTDFNLMQNRIIEELSVKTTTFVYPFGVKTETAEEALKKLGFAASLTCYDKINTITAGDPESLFSMGRRLRPHGVSASQVFSEYLSVSG